MDWFKRKKRAAYSRKADSPTRWVWISLAATFLVASLVVVLFQITSAGGQFSETEPSPTEFVQAFPAETAPAAKDEPVLVPPPPEIEPSATVSLLPRDSIQAIDDPQFVNASEANRFMSADEKVIGLDINGDIRAYPIPVLSVHEIINDDVGGEPIAVTWCPLCYTALVFSRRSDIPDVLLTFGVSGKLLNNTLVMYDRESDSLWSQLYGAALVGPMAGARLSFFPSVFTQWSTWVAQHPDTLVLDKEAACEAFNCGTYSSNPRGSYDVDPYESYYNRSDEGVINRQIPRDSEEAIGTAKERVLGIRIAGQARAYPYSELGDRTLINDMVNGVPILVWLDSDTHTGLAYLRTIDALELSFFADDESTTIIIDEETGSEWDVTSGTALNGPLRGTQLTPVFATSAFEFGWYDYFPNSETFSK